MGLKKIQEEIAARKAYRSAFDKMGVAAASAAKLLNKLSDELDTVWTDRVGVIAERYEKMAQDNFDNAQIESRVIEDLLNS